MASLKCANAPKFLLGGIFEMLHISVTRRVVIDGLQRARHAIVRCRLQIKIVVRVQAVRRLALQGLPQVLTTGAGIRGQRERGHILDLLRRRSSTCLRDERCRQEGANFVCVDHRGEGEETSETSEGQGQEHDGRVDMNWNFQEEVDE